MDATCTSETPVTLFMFTLLWNEDLLIIAINLSQRSVTGISERTSVLEITGRGDACQGTHWEATLRFRSVSPHHPRSLSLARVLYRRYIYPLSESLCCSTLKGRIKVEGAESFLVPPAVSAPRLLGWLLILPRPVTHAALSSCSSRKPTVVLKPENPPSSPPSLRRLGAGKNLQNKSCGLERVEMNGPLVREQS
jgi:hypothetical protein